MNAYQAAQHYQKVLHNVAERYARNAEDAKRMKAAIKLYGKDELTERYGAVPKVIWDNSSFRLGTFELGTDFGWIDLSEYGLDKKAAEHAEPFHSGCLCFYA